MFRTVAARVSGGRDVSYELIAFDVGGDLAWTVGCSRFAVAIDGGEPVQHTLRLTHLYRREDGAWKVIHEHSDFQPADHEIPAPISASRDHRTLESQGVADDFASTSSADLDPAP
jgi:ketosteroid isomerase-like protein